MDIIITDSYKHIYKETPMTTIKDIANRLGVSVSTVSKGLNGASDISEDCFRYRRRNGIFHKAFQKRRKS